MDVKKTGVFLAQLRHEKGLTQEQLGERLGVTNKTVSRWENGNYLPPVEMLQSLSTFYGVSINEILSGERLTDAAYREKAEENIKAAIGSSFSLKERMDFFKAKWRREHIFDFVLGMVVTIALYAAGIFWMEGLAVLGYFFCIGFLLVQHNRMMAYVEERAFDGSGRL